MRIARIRFRLVTRQSATRNQWSGIHAFARELSCQQVDLEPFYAAHVVSGMPNNTAMLPTATPRSQQISGLHGKRIRRLTAAEQPATIPVTDLDVGPNCI